jgi:hypothetical protein
MPVDNDHGSSTQALAAVSDQDPSASETTPTQLPSAKPGDPNTGHYIGLLNYHHDAMESRRSIQLKIFTGSTAFFLVVTKVIYEARENISDTPFVPWGIGFAFLVLLLTYLFMLWRIETATTFDREKYHRLEDHLRSILPACSPPSEIKNRTRGNETILDTLLRSWASVPPFLATVIIAGSCWIFLVFAASNGARVEKSQAAPKPFECVVTWKNEATPKTEGPSKTETVPRTIPAGATKQ